MRGLASRLDRDDRLRGRSDAVRIAVRCPALPPNTHERAVVHPVLGPGVRAVGVTLGFGERVRAIRVLDRRPQQTDVPDPDRKSTRLNSSHVAISYAVFCLK